MSMVGSDGQFETDLLVIGLDGTSMTRLTDSSKSPSRGTLA